MLQNIDTEPKCLCIVPLLFVWKTCWICVNCSGLNCARQVILNFEFSCRYGSGENSSIHLHHGWRPTHQIYRVQGKDYVLKHCKNLVSHTQNKCHARKHVTQKHVTQKTCHTKTCHAKTYHAKYMSRKKTYLTLIAWNKIVVWHVYVFRVLCHLPYF